jgi:glycosyltransferase involved in cell wall biosynthesis
MPAPSEPLLLETRARPLPVPPCRAGGPITVLLSSSLPAAVAQIQLRALARDLPVAGVHARHWLACQDSLAGADCLHLFGTAPEHIAIAETAQRQGVKVVLSPLAWLDGGAPRGLLQPLARRVSAWAGFVGRSVCPGLWPWRRQLYQLVDLLVPHSNAEAQQLMRQFQSPAERIQVVPLGAEPRFAEADPAPFTRLFGVRNHVLCLGPVEPCNNQLGFLWAIRELDLPVVIMGDVPPGFEWYLDECRRVAGSRVRFLPSLDHDDPMLASAYAACACLMLPAGLETAALTALEAAMSGTPLVLAEGDWANEYLGQQAVYARPEDAPGIRHAVVTALARGRSQRLAQHVRTWFSSGSTAKSMWEVYRTAVRGRG